MALSSGISLPKVYSEAKEGLDAGEIIGAEKTGVVATRDVDAILALEPDCLIYCPMPWDLAEMCRLLEAGIHVLTPCPYWFPFVQDPEVAAAIGKACKRGHVNFHASGCNPGGIAERFPLTFSGWCNRIDRITMTECGDCRTYSSEGSAGSTTSGAEGAFRIIAEFAYRTSEKASKSSD